MCVFFKRPVFLQTVNFTSCILSKIAVKNYKAYTWIAITLEIYSVA